MSEQLLERGDRVAGTARKLERLGDLQSRYGDRLWIASLDVTDTAAIRKTVNDAFAYFGRIDVVVNNAGYALFGTVEEFTDEQIVHQINTNLIGSIQVIRAALPHLRAQGGGRILQVSSEGGQITYPGFGLYHTTKWGIEGFVETLAKEVAPFNIGFTIVEPGPAKTGFAGGLVSPSALRIYENTPAGEMRQIVESGSFKAPGDPAKMAGAMIDSVDRNPAPQRLPLGSGAYDRVHQTLTERLAALEAQKEIATSTEVTD